jgi:hypothetical protein
LSSRRVIREEKKQAVHREKEVKELATALEAKFEREVEELKRKQKANMELMESKFNTENALLNDEFLFLTQELDKLQSLAVRKERENELIFRENQCQKENTSMNKMAAELEAQAQKIDQDIRRLVGLPGKDEGRR